MLRRKPTAITITTEDISAFDTAHAQRLAYVRYRRTGEDPLGLFSQHHRHTAVDQAQQTRHQSWTTSTHTGSEFGSPGAAGDPSDELKPLPGDRARIVRGREERILGTRAAGAAGQGAVQGREDASRGASVNPATAGGQQGGGGARR